MVQNGSSWIVSALWSPSSAINCGIQNVAFSDPQSSCPNACVGAELFPPTSQIGNRKLHKFGNGWWEGLECSNPNWKMFWDAAVEIAWWKPGGVNEDWSVPSKASSLLENNKSWSGENLQGLQRFEGFWDVCFTVFCRKTTINTNKPACACLFSHSGENPAPCPLWAGPLVALAEQMLWGGCWFTSPCVLW